MTEPLSQVSGHIRIGDKDYAARDVLMALLEQGITVYETNEGLRIGIKIVQPKPIDSMTLDTACPAMKSYSLINHKLQELSKRVEELETNRLTSPPPSRDFRPKVNDPYQLFPPRSKRSDNLSSFLKKTPTYLDDRKRCSVCGATLQKDAFFCVKCGTSVRST